jgi:hypothetical protein
MLDDATSIVGRLKLHEWALICKDSPGNPPQNISPINAEQENGN